MDVLKKNLNVLYLFSLCLIAYMTIYVYIHYYTADNDDYYLKDIF